MREMRDRRIQVGERMTAICAGYQHNLAWVVSVLTPTVPGIARAASPKLSGVSELGI